jgi:hypothetical protein
MKKQKIFDLSKKTDRDQIIAEHKSISHLEPPENDYLRVFETDSAGLGVIAHAAIKKNQIICTYHGKVSVQEIKDGVIPQYEEIIKAVAAKKKELTQNKDKPLTPAQQEELDEFTHQFEKLIGNYVFVLKETKKQYVTVHSHRHAGIAALVNCSWNGLANVKAKLQNNQIVFVALRDIKPGEEILIDYGYDYTDSIKFQHIFPVGTRSIKQFLEQNTEHYPTQPIPLNKTDRRLLATKATHVLVPYYCSDPRKWKTYTGKQINSLPLIEMVKPKSGKKFKPLPSQQFITAFMYACLKTEEKVNKTLFDKLIQKKVCVDFVTKNGCSAWYILTALYSNSTLMNKMCEKLTKTIYQLYDKRGWGDAYQPYIQKNLYETSQEIQQAIFSAIFTPPQKSKKLPARKKTNYKRVRSIRGEVASEAKSESSHISFPLLPIQPEVNSPNSSGEDMIIEAKETKMETTLIIEPVLPTEIEDKVQSEEKLIQPAEMKLDIIMEPLPHLKRSDSIPLLEAVPPAENKLIDLPLRIKKSNHHKRKRDCIDLTIEPVVKKQLAEYPGLDQKEIKTYTAMENKYLNISFMEAELKSGVIGRELQKYKINPELVLLALKRGITVAAFLVLNNQAECLVAILEQIPSGEDGIAFVNAPLSCPGEWHGHTALTIGILKYSYVDFYQIDSDTEEISILEALLGPIPYGQHFKQVTQPLEQGANKGWTPIAVAAICNKLPNIDFIISTVQRTEAFTLLNSFQPGGTAQGLSPVAIAVKSRNVTTLKVMLEHPRITEDQEITLINTPQMEGSEAGLTVLEIAVKYYCEDVFAFLLDKVIFACRLDLVQKPQPTGEYQGCTLLAVAVLKKSLAAVRALTELEASERGADQRVSLITAPQGQGRYVGMTAISLAVQQEEIKIFDFLLKSCEHKKISVLTHPQPAGCYTGYNAISLAAKLKNVGVFSSLLATIGKDNLFKLINIRQEQGIEKGLTPFDFAILSGDLAVILLMLNAIPDTQRLAMLNAIQPTGSFEGCTNFAIVVYYRQLSLIKEILNKNADDNIKLITALQGGFLKGLTAISIAVKWWDLDLLSYMLRYLPLQYRLSLLKHHALQGEEKGLSALEIAAKYKKPRDVATLMAYLRPLTIMPPTVSIVQNQSVSFNFSRQITVTSNTTTATTNASITLTQTNQLLSRNGHFTN